MSCTFTIIFSTEPTTPLTTKKETNIQSNLNELLISNHPKNSIPEYNRSEWKHWTDDDGDCINTRHEVLILESKINVIMRDKCNVDIGYWVDLFTGEIFEESKLLDVDHMVPLANAHYSGGWEWSSSKRKTFANYLSYENHLIAVTASANRQKGSSSPDEWKPGLTSYWCQYGLDWINIKLEWSLSVTSSEGTALQEMLSTCATDINYIGENQMHVVYDSVGKTTLSKRLNLLRPRGSLVS